MDIEKIAETLIDGIPAISFPARKADDGSGCIVDANNWHFLSIFGYARFGKANNSSAEEIYNGITEFVIEALNNEWERRKSTNKNSGQELGAINS